jgi:CubicO group peptidase (beta-lactamase class C family)
VTVPPANFARFLDEAAARRPLGAVGAAAIEHSEIAWTSYAGADSRTVFQAGSLSKTVTSAVALELVERGELGLDDNLRALLSHTSGANVPFYPGYARDEAMPTLAESVARVEFDPKAAGRFRYSGGGYTVVQQLIEESTGESFAEVARQAVLEPRGMTRSTFEQPPPAPLLESAAFADWRLYPECAAAGLWTTPADLARFVCAVEADPGPMTEPHAAVPRRGQWLVLSMLGLAHPQSAGLGVFLRGHRFINLGGAAGSFSVLTGSTEDGTGAVVMTAGFRQPFALRVLFQLEDAQGWSGVRGSRLSEPFLRLLS